MNDGNTTGSRGRLSLDWSGPQGVYRINRANQYAVLALEPVLAALAATVVARHDAGAGVVVATVALLLAHSASALAVVRTGKPGSDEGCRPLRVPLIALAVTSAAAVAFALSTLPQAYEPGYQDSRQIVVGVVGVFSATALAARRPMRTVLPVIAAAAALSALEGQMAGHPGVGAPLLVAVVAAAFAGAMRAENYYSRTARTLAEAKETEARLAVAEERLRFARDLHDVVGHALAAVALKSQVAAELGRRSDPRAIDEMDSVRAVAQEAHSEVRRIVTGYRAEDLTAVVAGARALLASAGVTVRVVGDPGALPRSVQSVFGWLVREGVTNVVRHATDASTCTIELSDDDGVAVVRMVNDGVPCGPGGPDGLGTAGGPGLAGRPGAAGGNGLTGLTERLTAVGGTLTARREGDRFVLTARMPSLVPASARTGANVPGSLPTGKRPSRA